MSLHLCLKNDDDDIKQINDFQPLPEAQQSVAAAAGAVPVPLLSESSNMIGKSVGLDSPCNGAGQQVGPEQQMSLSGKSESYDQDLPSMAVKSWRRMSLHLCLKNDDDIKQINDFQPLPEAQQSAAAASGAVPVPLLSESSNIFGKSVGLDSPCNGAGQQVGPEQQMSLSERYNFHSFAPLPLNSQNEDGGNYRLSLLSGHTSRSDMMIVTYHNVPQSANQHRDPNTDNRTLKNGPVQELRETSYTPVGAGVEVHSLTSPIAIDNVPRVDAGASTETDEIPSVQQVCAIDGGRYSM